ncbi:MAG: hypothetical protein K6G23_03745 [Lachnospiraceae bacterium]|nr:hypothetical protein [Lachnospiraceae bacterium]
MNMLKQIELPVMLRWLPGNQLLTTDNYTLTVIEDEPVALAAGPATEQISGAYIGAVIAVILIAAILGGLYYYLECRKCQMRIGALHKGKEDTAVIPYMWSLSKLRDQVREEEAIAADGMMKNFEFDEN